MRIRRVLAAVLAVVCVAALAACAEKPGSGGAGSGSGSGSGSEVRIAIGGQPLLVYLPTTLAQQLGYYEREGVNVKLEDLQGGSKALQALQGGSADVVSGYYDHTIQMQAQRREVVAFVNMLRYPAIVLAVSPKTKRSIRSIADLKGATVGVTAPGSSTDFFLKYLLVKNGLPADAAAVQGIGADATAVAAMERGKVDAGVMLDPAFSLLQKRAGTVKVLADTRSAEGVREAYGVDTYPAAVLYSRTDWVDANKETATKLAKAILDTLTWIREHSAQEIADKMPKEYAGGDPALYVEAIGHLKAAYSPDGKIHEDGARTVLEVLSEFEPDIAKAKVDLTKTYTNDLLP